MTCSADRQRLLATARAVAGGIDSASQARPRSRYGLDLVDASMTVSITVKLREPSNRAISSRLAGDRSPSATTTGTSRTSVVAA